MPTREEIARAVAAQSPPTLADMAKQSPALDVKCPNCLRVAEIALSELMARCGADAFAARVASRLSCSACGRRPVWTWWRNPHVPRLAGYPAWQKPVR